LRLRRERASGRCADNNVAVFKGRMKQNETE
jgi:hypothetical protein